MKELFTVILIGHLTLTSYRSVTNQTDSTPYNTSTGERVSISGAAISQDLLCGACRRLHKRCQHPEYSKKIHYGDCIYATEIGFRIINDCMGLTSVVRVQTKKGIKKIFYKQERWIDVWVPKLKDEQEFHRKFGITKHKIYLIKEKYK